MCCYVADFGFRLGKEELCFQIIIESSAAGKIGITKDSNITVYGNYIAY